MLIHYLMDNRFMIWVTGLQLEVQVQLLAVTQFTTPVDHGLAVGNKFRVLNSNDVNLGDFVVTSVVGITQFSAKTTIHLQMQNIF